MAGYPAAAMDSRGQRPGDGKLVAGERRSGARLRGLEARGAQKERKRRAADRMAN